MVPSKMMSSQSEENKNYNDGTNNNEDYLGQDGLN